MTRWLNDGEAVVIFRDTGDVINGAKILNPEFQVDTADVGRIMEQIGSDAMLLFSTDYPHWQFEADAVMPAGFSADLARRITHDNPLATYPRLRETLS